MILAGVYEYLVPVAELCEEDKVGVLSFVV